ncbi:MAG: RHS repeat-associated core domain-containing protein [Anaerolineaceae bacterium]|nr:RHS repeat-associated core domain-containing protein [Anaerolineaceae bacterium]
MAKTFTFDEANRLTNLAVNGGATYSYTYNGNGDRLSQTVGSTITQYTLDLNGELTQVLSDGASLYFPDMGQSNLDGSNPEFYITDANGSNRLMTNASGAIVGAPQTYDPFGSVTSTPVSSIGYNGQWTDASGLEYLRARYYDPAMGRFISADPSSGNISNPATMNGFNYADDNPIGFDDPSGYYLDPQYPMQRGTIIHNMIQAQYMALYGVGEVSIEVPIPYGSASWLRTKNGTPTMKVGEADIIDTQPASFGFVNDLYEIKPENSLEFGLNTVDWYITVWDTYNPPNDPLMPGYHYPAKPGVIVGTDPNNPNNWIIGEEYGASGVILYRSESKGSGRPIPVYVFEWDPKLHKVVTRPSQSLALSPSFNPNPVFGPICAFGVMTFLLQYLPYLAFAAA